MYDVQKSILKVVLKELGRFGVISDSCLRSAESVVDLAEELPAFFESSGYVPQEDG